MSTPTHRFALDVDRSGNGELEIDGEPVTGVQGVTLQVDGVGNVPRLTIDYACFGATVAGEAEVVHYCPEGDDEAEYRRNLEAIARAARAFAEAAGLGGRLLPAGFTLGQSAALRELLRLVRPATIIGGDDTEEASR